MAVGHPNCVCVSQGPEGSVGSVMVGGTAPEKIGVATGLVEMTAPWIEGGESHGNMHRLRRKF